MTIVAYHGWLLDKEMNDQIYIRVHETASSCDMIVTISYVGSKYVTQPYKRPIYSQHDTTPDIMYECNHLHVGVVHSTIEQGFIHSTYTQQRQVIGESPRIHTSHRVFV